jgi:hypothetical protein
VLWRDRFRAHGTNHFLHRNCVLGNVALPTLIVVKFYLRGDSAHIQARMLTFQKATAPHRFSESRVEGYPESAHRKKRARLVTYRHSEERYFENGLATPSNVNDL